MNDTHARKERTFLEAGFFGLFVIWLVIGTIALAIGCVFWASTGRPDLIGLASCSLATSGGCLLIIRLARA